MANVFRAIQAKNAARRSFAEFVQLAWREVETRPFQHNWHIDAICGKLEEVSRGEVRSLLIMCPPRHSKSLLTTVFWPAWTWLARRPGMPLTGPRTSFAFASWSAALSVDHNLTLRRLVDSPWYRAAAGGTFAIDPKVSRSDDFRLSSGGRAFATSVSSTVTGFGFDIRIVDDPHQLQTIDSVADRTAVTRWYGEAWRSRVEDPKQSAEVIIMQRAHQHDLVGYILDSPQGKNFDILCLPAEYDPEHPQRWARDPRTVPGQLLDEDRFGPEGYAAISPATLFAKSAQMQQLPVPRGGSVFKSADWQFADVAPKDIRLVRYWDLAATAAGSSGDPDWTAGALGGFDKHGLFWLLDMQHGRWGPSQVEQRLRLAAAELDPPGTQIWIEEEPGSSGKMVTSYHQRLVLRGFSVRGDRATGPKSARVNPLVGMAESGNVVLVRGAWNRAFLDECETFTGEESSAHDDQVIAAAGAFKCSSSVGGFSASKLLGV